MLRRELQRGAVGSPKHDRDVELPARHVEQLGGRVEHLIERQHREVPGHELDYRSKPDHRRADADAGETQLGDWRVDNSHLAELLQQSLRDFVRALVDGHFLTHQKDAVVALHLFAQRLVQGVSIRDGGHRYRYQLWDENQSAATGWAALSAGVSLVVSTRTSSNSASNGGSELRSAKSHASWTVAFISSSSL